LEPDVFELYYGIDQRWTIALHNQQLFSISEERSDGFSYADRHLFMFARNLGLEEVELREVGVEEIPEFIREPKKLLAKEGIQLEELKRNESEQKIFKAVRNRR
jgi:hypothetical protein